MYYKYNADVVDGSRIDELDGDAISPTSTKDTSGLALTRLP